MKYRSFELHFRRQEGIFGRERQSRSEEATSIISTLVVYHQHDLPLEDAVSNQTAADAWNVLIALHLFELAAQQASCRTRRRHIELGKPDQEE